VSDWLVVMSEDNWEVCAREGLLGRGAQRRLERMAEGDRVWVYVNSKHVDRQLQGSPSGRSLRAASPL
jgi:hypothetical protein